MSARAAAALARQLEDWRAALAGGAERVGWKLGVGDRERIDGEIAVGHLTTATLLVPGSTYVAPAGADLHADAEIVAELARDVDPTGGPDVALQAIGGYGLALELVDLAPLPGEPDSVVAANVFHRAVAFGAMQPTLPAGEEAALIVNGERRAEGRAPDELGERVAAAARSLARGAESFRAGDRIITGSIVQVPVAPGDEVVAELGALRVSLVVGS